MAKSAADRISEIFERRKPDGGAEIAPSILSADFAHLARDLVKCRRAKANWIHIDAMDGHFVPNLTIGPPVVKSIRAAEPSLFFDCHLMLSDPMRYAPDFVKAGAQLVTIHAEASHSLERDLKALRAAGAKAGVSIKPGTPVKAIRDVLPLADLVLVMTVEPGFGGQGLIASALNKVRDLDLIRRRGGLAFRLQVDGGINRETAPLAAAAGADVLVAGTAVFGGADGVEENLKALREAIAKAAPARSATAKPPARRRRAK